MTEVLAPAGNSESFFAAVNAGADAIYLGLKEFSARKSAENFSVENIEYYIRYAHFFGVKIYIAVNTLVKDNELEDFFDTVIKAYYSGADAFILQDIFIGKKLKELLPDICLHLSTQAGVCNAYGAKIAKEYGFSRVILARETSFSDIAEITKIIETEVFVQGALCTSFSGHCYMSSFAGGYSGNRGYCKQPCRKKYTYSGKGLKPFTGYNLSLSDLCLKDELSSYVNAGVSSFKIEGRMRSPEYVYSAVSVYKKTLQGENCDEDFKHLRRSFNRGDYTTAYFKSNMRGIISNKIQGNIGDFIGNVSRVNGRAFTVESSEKFSEQDGFKILRNGYEVGSATFKSLEKNRANFISSAQEVKAGDEIRITKDTGFAKSVSLVTAKKRIHVEIAFEADNSASAKISYNGILYQYISDDVFTSANNAALSEKDVVTCFQKVDGYPFDPVIDVKIFSSVFVPKSLLNAFRRKCYASFFEDATRVERGEKSLDISLSNCIISDVKDNKIAVISNDFSFYNDDISAAIFRPFDYSDASGFEKFFAQIGHAEKFLYVPPYANGLDIEIIRTAVKGFDGVYCEGFFGFEFAKCFGVELFCGTGFNVFNHEDVCSLSGRAKYYAFSKELALSETADMGKEGFTLALGQIQVMDLIYCPFGHNCADCRRGNEFLLKDEDGREFFVRRYKLSSCRFEVYNPYRIVSQLDGRRIFDFTNIDADICRSLLDAKSVEEYREILKNYTFGNLNRGIR